MLLAANHNSLLSEFSTPDLHIIFKFVKFTKSFSETEKFLDELKTRAF